MPLVRIIDVESAPPEVRQEYERMAAHAAGGLAGVRPRTSPLLGTLAHHPELLSRHIDELIGTLADGALPRRVKESLAVAYSMASGCRYCTTNHTAVLRARFGFTDAMIAELGAVVAHVSSAVAAGQLSRAGVWGEVDAQAPRERVPAEAPGLDGKTKALIGLTVAACRGAEDAMSWYVGQLRRLGATDAELHETAAVILLFARVNQFTMGMLLEPVSQPS